MKKKWILALVLISILFLKFVGAECNEENIRFTIVDSLKKNEESINKNIDDSFRNYESYNVQQMNDWVNHVNEVMVRGVTIGLISLFSIVSFTMALWGLIWIRRTRRILSMINDNIINIIESSSSNMMKGGLLEKPNKSGFGKTSRKNKK